MTTVDMDFDCIARVNGGPTLDEYLKQVYGIQILQSDNGVKVVDLNSQQIWSPRIKVVTDYSDHEST